MVSIKKKLKKKCKNGECDACDKWNIVHEEGREVIQQWRSKRMRMRGARKSYHEFLIHSFTLDTIKSFYQNINLMVVLQIVMALCSVYVCEVLEVSFDLPVVVLVSPIVFPLAFSINTDFQRREKVLEDLAVFKSSGMIWFFCMREWKTPAGLDDDWITAVHGKLKSLLFHLREYLLTYRLERRKIILRAMYEDFSDANQLIEKLRASELPANTAIVSKSVQLLNTMCLSFERLRVIREYRSPRSIRSFNKVFIMFLPMILSPYFLYLGIKSNNNWEPYYIAFLVAFVFSSLQSVQDKLDDPFGGMSEDDINLDTIDEWTFGSLEHAMKRTFDIGRFKVTVGDTREIPNTTEYRVPPTTNNVASAPRCRRKFGVCVKKPPLEKCRSYTLPCADTVSMHDNNVPNKEKVQKLASLLDGVTGNTRINRTSLHGRPSQIQDIKHDDVRKLYSLQTISEPSFDEEYDVDNELKSFDDTSNSTRKYSDSNTLTLSHQNERSVSTEGEENKMDKNAVVRSNSEPLHGQYDELSPCASENLDVENDLHGKNFFCLDNEYFNSSCPTVDSKQNEIQRNPSIHNICENTVFPDGEICFESPPDYNVIFVNHKVREGNHNQGMTNVSNDNVCHDNSPKYDYTVESNPGDAQELHNCKENEENRDALKVNKDNQNIISKKDSNNIAVIGTGNASEKIKLSAAESSNISPISPISPNISPISRFHVASVTHSSLFEEREEPGSTMEYDKRTFSGTMTTKEPVEVMRMYES